MQFYKSCRNVPFCSQTCNSEDEIFVVHQKSKGWDDCHDHKQTDGCFSVIRKTSRICGDGNHDGSKFPSIALKWLTWGDWDDVGSPTCEMVMSGPRPRLLTPAVGIGAYAMAWCSTMMPLTVYIKRRPNHLVLSHKFRPQPHFATYTDLQVTRLWLPTFLHLHSLICVAYVPHKGCPMQRWFHPHNHLRNIPVLFWQAECLACNGVWGWCWFQWRIETPFKPGCEPNDGSQEGIDNHFNWLWAQGIRYPTTDCEPKLVVTGGE